MLTAPEAAAEVMKHLCAHDAHGYSQPARKGDGTEEVITLSDGYRAHLPGGDKDCSEAVRVCYAAVSILPYKGYMWTGNEHEVLTSVGFQELPFEGTKLQVGDVLWKKGHTEIYVGDGMQGGFRGDENGGLGQGAKQGDQTGYEASLMVVRSYWTKVYRYKGGAWPQGWIKAGSRWWYQFHNGKYPRNEWLKTGGSWYHFDSKGYMETGWVKVSGHWFYFTGDGKMVYKCCRKINGKWFVFRSNGEMNSGPLKFNSDGSIIFD